jgi:two-component system CheB/CheR fusion protein
LQHTVLQVISDFRTVEKEITDRHGHRFQSRVLPYRTVDNKVDGAVITLVDISRQSPGGDKLEKTAL